MDTSLPTELSPNLVSLLRKKLGITRIGTQTLRYISEELNNGAEFDLDDPDELKEFLDYVRRQYRRVGPQYPDLTVVCEPPLFANTRTATLLNPTLIVEVLSPSTERADRGMKFDCYRTLESFHTYVLVSQVEPRIEIYSRQSDGTWRYDVTTGSQSILRLETIGCELRLAEIYARVVFPPASALEIAE